MNGPASSCAFVLNFERLGPLSAPERASLELLADGEGIVEARRKLIDDGRRCDQLFILKRGWLVDFKQLRDGGRQVLHFRLPGDIVGLECLAYNVALHSTAALTECTVARLSRGAVEKLQRDHPRLAVALVLLMLRDQAILHHWAINLGRRSGFARVAHLLLELSFRLRIRCPTDGPGVVFPLTQQDIADCTGLTAPYVNRILQEMRRRDLLHFADQVLEMRDPEDLARLTDFRPDYLQTFPKMPDPLAAAPVPVAIAIPPGRAGAAAPFAP